MKVAILQTQRTKDVLRQQLLVTLAREPLENEAEDDVAVVRVAMVRSRLEQQRPVLQNAGLLLERVVSQRICRVLGREYIAETGAVTKEMQNSDPAGNGRRKSDLEAIDGVVQGKGAPLDLL